VVGGEEEDGVPHRRGRGEHLAGARIERRHEEALEAELVLAALGVPVVGDLDDAGRGEVAVLLEEGDGAAVGRAALAVLDGDDRGVAGVHQVDLGVADLQRVVDLDPGLLLLAVGALPVRDVGAVVACRALLRAGLLVRRVEVLEAEAEEVQVVRGEEGAGLEVVVLGEGVGEAVALDDQLAAVRLPQLPRGEGQQQHDQRDVEEEVARLAQIALLGGDGVLRSVHAEAPSAQQPAGAAQHLAGCGVGPPRRVRGHPVEAAGGARRPAAQLAHELPGARDDAAGQRDEEQDVDRGEPHRRVDVEELQLLVDGREYVVLLLELLDLDAVDVGLRNHRTRDRREGEQEEQQQRHPHRRQLPPEPARPADDADGGDVELLLAGCRGELGLGLARQPRLLGGPFAPSAGGRVAADGACGLVGVRAGVRRTHLRFPRCSRRTRLEGRRRSGPRRR
jgi:hypothetical protein